MSCTVRLNLISKDLIKAHHVMTQTLTSHCIAFIIPFDDYIHVRILTAINGYAFESGPVLGFCNGEVATWHVSSVGAQDYIQTATFYGHPFMLNERTEDFLSLYPMTGETITMKMDNIGQWRITIPFFKSHPIVLPVRMLCT